MGVQKTKREQSTEEKKAVILNEALSLFKQYGYENTSIRDICEATGFTQGSIYNFYGSKEGILISFADNLLPKDSSFMEPTEENIAAPLNAIYDYMCCLCNRMDELGINIVSTLENMHTKIWHKPDGKPLFGRNAKKMAALIEKCQEAGTFDKSEKPIYMATLMYSIFHETVILWMYNYPKLKGVDCLNLIFWRFTKGFLPEKIGD